MMALPILPQRVLIPMAMAWTTTSTPTYFLQLLAPMPDDNGETPSGFPNTDIVGGEPNWREATAGGAAAPIELLSFSAYSLPNGTGERFAGRLSQRPTMTSSP